MAQFIISAFADEAATDLYEQIKECKKYGINHIEIRNYSLNGVVKNISDASVEDAIVIKKILDENDMRISSIGSFYGKIEITDDFEPHFKAFKNTVEVARILGAKYIRMFSFFFRQGQDVEAYKDEVVSRVKAMADYSYDRGILCCHENEKEIFGDIADRCVYLHEAIGKKLGGIFDPSNYIQCGEDTLLAYDKVEKYLTYFHVKDCQSSDGYVVPCGYGDGHISELLDRFSKKDGDRFLTIEPHLKVFEGLRALDADSAQKAEHSRFQYADTKASFKAAVNALYKILGK